MSKAKKAALVIAFFISASATGFGFYEMVVIGITHEQAIDKMLKDKYPEYSDLSRSATLEIIKHKNIDEYAQVELEVEKAVKAESNEGLTWAGVAMAGWIGVCATLVKMWT